MVKQVCLNCGGKITASYSIHQQYCKDCWAKNSKKSKSEYKTPESVYSEEINTEKK